MTGPPATRPDPESLAYARYWEPVIADAAHRLLTRIAPAPVEFLDIGAGTGSLPLAAADRWPSARIVGLDASAGMLSVARHRIADHRSADDPGRFEWIAADAARMPLADASFDAVTSAFMLQLVDDRDAVLREVLRVLRPGGRFALVTWLAEDLGIEADVVFDQVVANLGLELPASDFRISRSTDYHHLEEPRAELKAAGFDDIDAGPDALAFSWSRDGYLDFKEHYDECDLFESLASADRDRLRAALVTRMRELPAAAFSIDAPLVWATARRPHLA
jgi:ubiquinone/menaquinone biosynthesis C-methylase UbiE